MHSISWFSSQSNHPARGPKLTNRRIGKQITPVSPPLHPCHHQCQRPIPTSFATTTVFFTITLFFFKMLSGDAGSKELPDGDLYNKKKAVRMEFR